MRYTEYKRDLDTVVTIIHRCWWALLAVAIGAIVVAADVLLHWPLISF